VLFYYPQILEARMFTGGIKSRFYTAAVVACLTVLILFPARVAAQVKPLQKDFVRVYVTVMDPDTVKDAFGTRIGNRFIAIQVTITNRNPDFQYLIHDVSLDLRKVFSEEAVRRIESRSRGGKPDLELSSVEMSLLRGVSEKGQGQDPRNYVLRILRGIGTVAGGLVGVAGFGPSFAEAVAVFNGPVIAAYSDVLPDYTINQLNRLNDSAYRSNTLVAKQQAKVLVAFIPQSMFMDKKQRSLFKKDPVTLFDTGEVDFRRAEAVVDGDFITTVGNLPPVVAGIQIDPSEMRKFQDSNPVVKGFVQGGFLTNAKISLLTPIPPGVEIEPDGTPTDTQLNFTIKSPKPIAPGNSLTFEIRNDRGVQTILRPLSYSAKLPTLTGTTPNPAQGKAGEEVTITLKGTNFVPSGVGLAPAMRVLPESGSKVDVVSLEVIDGTTMQVKLRIDRNAPQVTSQIRVLTESSGQSVESVPFTVTAPANP
jgi:hypothetical protein